jgi:hypothetical protein
MIAFDIEIADEFTLAPGEDLDAHGPFHISVAAVYDASNGRSRVWHSSSPAGEPTGHLTPEGAREVLRFLRDRQREGLRIMAWNGLSFDLKWLGHAAEDMALAAEVARDLIDPMFHFFCLKGFPVGLQAVADGMRLGAQKLMDAKDAPREWRLGNHQRVIDYVIEDCRITTVVGQAIESKRHIRWRTSRGSVSDVSIPKLLTVAEAMKLPEADTSWMDKPIPRQRFVGWMTECRR